MAAQYAEDVRRLEIAWGDAVIALRAAQLRYEQARRRSRELQDALIKARAEQSLGRQIDGGES